MVSIFFHTVAPATSNHLHATFIVTPSASYNLMPAQGFNYPSISSMTLPDTEFSYPAFFEITQYTAHPATPERTGLWHHSTGSSRSLISNFQVVLITKVLGRIDLIIPFYPHLCSIFRKSKTTSLILELLLA